MPNQTPRTIQERLSKILDLRANVRRRLDVAGMKELLEWQKLEPEALQLGLTTIKSGVGAEEVTAEMRVELENVIERLARLHASLSKPTSTETSAARSRESAPSPS